MIAQTLANPFANVRDDPEFVEWGYGGMGSVQASAGIGSDMWKGVQRSERGGALLTGSSLGSSPTSTHPATGAVVVGGGRGSGVHATVRRKMSDNVPECGMGNVGGGGEDGEDDGSGMGWLKRRRAEKEAKARLEQEDLERKMQEKRKSGDSTMDASMYASTTSTTTSLTACTSATSTDLTSPTTSPLTSRSPSMTDLKLTSSLSLETRDLDAAPPSTVSAEQPSKSTAQPVPASKDDHAYHVLTAVRLSPNISSSSHKHERAPSSPVDAETSTHSSSEEEGHDDADDDEDDDEHEVQVGRLLVLTTTYKHLSHRTLEGLPSEPASRKSADM